MQMSRLKKNLKILFYSTLKDFKLLVEEQGEDKSYSVNWLRLHKIPCFKWRFKAANEVFLIEHHNDRLP